MKENNERIADKSSENMPKDQIFENDSNKSKLQPRRTLRAD
jgi:hypothetical protein